MFIVNILQVCCDDVQYVHIISNKLRLTGYYRGMFWCLADAFSWRTSVHSVLQHINTTGQSRRPPMHTIDRKCIPFICDSLGELILSTHPIYSAVLPLSMCVLYR